MMAPRIATSAIAGLLFEHTAAEQIASRTRITAGSMSAAQMTYFTRSMTSCQLLFKPDGIRR